MKHAVEPDVVGTLAILENTCAYCGAHFRVLATQVPEDNHPHEYACPDCGKHYTLQAVEEPEVRLLRRRDDGREDRYQETMF